MMKSYSQRDPLWRDIKIGATGYTIGRVGCLLTAIADLSTYFGSNYTPFSVMRKCSFTAEADLFWKSADFSNFAFEKLENFYNKAGVNAAMKDPHRALVFAVNGGAHWVAPIRWDWARWCWTICDPWFGDEAPASRYGNDITAVAYFLRK